MISFRARILRASLLAFLAGAGLRLILITTGAAEDQAQNGIIAPAGSSGSTVPPEDPAGSDQPEVAHPTGTPEQVAVPLPQPAAEPPPQQWVPAPPRIVRTATPDQQPLLEDPLATLIDSLPDPSQPGWKPGTRRPSDEALLAAFEQDPERIASAIEAAWRRQSLRHAAPGRERSLLLYQMIEAAQRQHENLRRRPDLEYMRIQLCERLGNHPSDEIAMALWQLLSGHARRLDGTRAELLHEAIDRARALDHHDLVRAYAVLWAQKQADPGARLRLLYEAAEAALLNDDPDACFRVLALAESHARSPAEKKAHWMRVCRSALQHDRPAIGLPAAAQLLQASEDGDPSWVLAHYAAAQFHFDLGARVTALHHCQSIQQHAPESDLAGQASRLATLINDLVVDP